MELRERFWDLQTMEPPDQIRAMAQLTLGLKNDSKQMSILVELFISAGALNEFDSSMLLLKFMQFAEASREVESVSRACFEMLSSIFRPVRISAASSGLLALEDVRHIFLKGSTELRKAIARSISSKKYPVFIPFTQDVADICETTFGEKSMVWKAILGGDPLDYINSGVSDPDSMVSIALAVSVDVLLNIVDNCDGVLSPAWLKILLRRCASDMLSLDIRQVIEKFLYHPSKWRLGSKPEKMFKYLWKHYGDEMLQVLVDFDTELDSVVTFTKLLELSSRASWNLQLTAFNRVVERIKDMSFSEVKMVLSYIQPINKSARSKNCESLFSLVRSVVSHHTLHIDLLNHMKHLRILPAIALVDYIVNTLLPTAKAEDQFRLVFRFGANVLKERDELPGRWSAAEKICPEFLEDEHLLSLYSALMCHPLSPELLNGGELVNIFQLFVEKCNSLQVIRQGLRIFINFGGVHVTPNTLLTTAQRMCHVDLRHNPTGQKTHFNPIGLPTEFLGFLREGTTPEAIVLLSQIQETCLHSLVIRHGRSTWWRLLIYGLGGVQPDLGSPKDFLRSVETKEISTDRNAVIENISVTSREVDREFEDELKLKCEQSGAFERMEGLISLLSSCEKITKYRGARLVYAIETLSTEMNNTEPHVMPLIRRTLGVLFETFRDAKEWTLLASPLSILWEKCNFSQLDVDLVHNFVLLAQKVLVEVAEGSVSPDDLGARLAADVLVATKSKYVSEILFQVVSKPPPISINILRLLTTAALAGTETHAQILALVLEICSRTFEPTRPEKLLSFTWANQLRSALENANDEFFILVGALEQLNIAGVIMWSPCKDSVVSGVLQGVVQQDVVSHSELVMMRDRLVALGQRRELLDSSVTDPEISGVISHNERLINETFSCVCKVVEDSAEIFDFLRVLFNPGCTRWMNSVDSECVYNLAMQFCRREVFHGGESVYHDGEPIPAVNSLIQSLMSCCGRRSNHTCRFLVERSDAVRLMIASQRFCRGLVIMNPHLLRKIFVRVRDSEILSVANVLRPLISEVHLPKVVAEDLSNLLLRASGLTICLCLASLLREVDVTDALLRRLSAMETFEITLVLKVALAAGHPLRTVVLIRGVTLLKDRTHRNMFERAIAQMSIVHMREVLTSVLNDASTGPSVAKLCLRLAKNMGLTDYMGLMMCAWKGGACHRDVLVRIMVNFAGFGNVCEEAKAVFDCAKVRPGVFSYVVREFMSNLARLQISWGSLHVVPFLTFAVEQGYANPRNLFALLLQRFVLFDPSASSVAEEHAMISITPMIIELLTKLLRWSVTLGNTTYHSTSQVAESWALDGMRFHSPGFYYLAGKCEFYFVANLILSLGPVRYGTTAFRIWANVAISEDCDLQDFQGRVAFALTVVSTFAHDITSALVELSKAASERARMISSPAKRAVILVLLRIIHERLGSSNDSVFVAQSSSLASLDTSADSLLGVLDTAALMDLNNGAPRNRANFPDSEVHNKHSLVETALLSATASSHVFEKLRWLSTSKFGKTIDGLRRMKHFAIDSMKCGGINQYEAVVHLLLPFRKSLCNFVDDLLNFSEECALHWLQAIIYEEELEVESNLHSPFVLSGKVVKTFSDILLKSTLSSFRIQVLRFLEPNQLEALIKVEKDKCVLILAYHLLFERSAELPE